MDRQKHIDDEGETRQQLQREFEKLDAETEEEVDALRVNLYQQDERDTSRDSTGRVVDDVAEEEIARFTEVGPLAENRGAVSVVPGREDVSRVLRRHQENTESANVEPAAQDNLEEPNPADEGTAA